MPNPVKQFVVDTIWDFFQDTGLSEQVSIGSKEELFEHMPEWVLDRFKDRLVGLNRVLGEQFSRYAEGKTDFLDEEDVHLVKLTGDFDE